MPAPDHGLKIFSTCPLSAQAQPGTCSRELQEFARSSEDAGYEGILVFTDNSQLDPWLVSQVIIEATERLCPLVAIQPTYMHPYSVAKMITSFAHLYGRRLYLNMVAGGFKNDLLALNDLTPHDERYARLLEYTTVIQSLLRTAGPVSFEGRYYKVTNLKLTPPLPADLQPGVLVSGSWNRACRRHGNWGPRPSSTPGHWPSTRPRLRRTSHRGASASASSRVPKTRKPGQSLAPATRRTAKASSATSLR